MSPSFRLPLCLALLMGAGAALAQQLPPQGVYTTPVAPNAHLAQPQDLAPPDSPVWQNVVPEPGVVMSGDGTVAGPGYVQPGYAQPGYPQPVYAQPVYAQPAYAYPYAPVVLYPPIGISLGFGYSRGWGGGWRGHGGWRR